MRKNTLFHLYKRNNKGYNVIASAITHEELQDKLDQLKESDLWNIDIVPIRVGGETLHSYEEVSYWNINLYK